MTSDAFETTRLMSMVLIVAVRFFLMPHYLQSYLNMAPEKLKDLRKEAGRISNVELQKMVCSFSCLLLLLLLLQNNFYESAKDMFKAITYINNNNKKITSIYISCTYSDFCNIFITMLATY